MTNSEDGSSTGPCGNALSQPSMCPVPLSTCLLHVTLCQKIIFFAILKPYFHHKNLRRYVDRRGLLQIKIKSSSPLKIAVFFFLFCFVLFFFFSFKNRHLPQLTKADTLLFNGWILNTNTLYNAWQTGHDSPSVTNLSNIFGTLHVSNSYIPNGRYVVFCLWYDAQYLVPGGGNK